MIVTRKAEIAFLLINTVTDKPISSRVFAKKHKLSLYCVEQVGVKLSNAEIIQSTRGPGGGYVKGARIETLTLLDVFDIVGEKIRIPNNSGTMKDFCVAINKALSKKARGINEDIETNN